MHDRQFFFGMLSGIVSLCAYIPLIIEWKRGWKPQRATWSIWAIVTSVIAASKIAGGAYESAFIPVFYSIGSAIIAILSFIRGEGEWDRLNTWCVAVALSGTALWVITDNPVTALVLNMVADLSAGAPTARELYHTPDRKQAPGWAVFFLGAILGLPAIREWTFIDAGYTLFVVPFIGGILLLTLRRPHRGLTIGGI